MSARNIDENGYILIENNPITREGIFEYLAGGVDSDLPPEQIVKVYRPRSEIEDQACLDSFKLIPLIDDHEMLGLSSDGFADAAEYGTHGTTGETVATRDGVMYATLKLFSETIANALKNGKKDLSLGYRCVYEKSKGTFAGESYDYVQRQLRGNHLALVDEARCAVSVLDQKITYDSIDIPSRKDKQSMDNEKEGKDELTLETLAEAVVKLTEKIDALSEKVGMEAEVKEEEKVEEGSEEESADEDADSEKKKDGEDSDGEEKDDKTQANANAGGALSASLDARLKKLELKTKALDSSDIVKKAMIEIKKRDALAEQLSHHVGTFDHSEKTLGEVAAYGVKKLGLDAKKGDEQAVLSGYLAGAKRSVPQASTMDSKRSGKPSIVDNYINGK